VRRVDEWHRFRYQNKRGGRLDPSHPYPYKAKRGEYFLWP
jgi:hypothetical protein